MIEYSKINVASYAYYNLNVKDRIIVQYRLFEDDLCFMGYKFGNVSELTYHHCFEKVVDSGQRTIENGAVLLLCAHGYLNLIEAKERVLYLQINGILQEINWQKTKPTKKQYIKINTLLKSFERRYENERNVRGFPLIKKNYLDRPYYYN
jgi:pyruvate carboxylase